MLFHDNHRKTFERCVRGTIASWRLRFCYPPGLWAVLVAQHEISHPDDAYDPQILVQNEQILQVVFVHDSPSFINRLIFEAEVGPFFHHAMDEVCFAEIISDRNLRRTRPSLSFAVASAPCDGPLERS